jgi:hypothetical protein
MGPDMNHRIARLLGMGLVAALAGCAAPPKATVNTEDVLLGRRLYDTEPAYIYASSERAANEVGVDLVVAARDYQKTTGHVAAGKGLLIVTDKGDPPYADRPTVLRMGKRYDDLASFGPLATMPADPDKVMADLDKALADARKELGPEAMDKLSLIFLIKVGTTDVASAIRQWDLAGRPAARADWVLAVPTSDLAQEAAHGMMRVAMSQKDVSVVQKILIAPLLPLLEAKVREAAVADRQIGTFLMLTLGDASLDTQAKKAAFQKYQKRKGEAVMQGMPGASAGNKPAGATRPAASAPAIRESDSVTK